MFYRFRLLKFRVLQIPAFTIPCFTDSGFYNSVFYRFRLLQFRVLQIPAFTIPCFTDSGFYNSVFYRFRLLQFPVFVFVSAAVLLPCCHQADIRMRLRHLLRLDDNKSAASCQQAWCKVKTSDPQAWCQLFQQLVASLREPIWWSQRTWCNLMTNLHMRTQIH